MIISASAGRALLLRRGAIQRPRSLNVRQQQYRQQSSSSSKPPSNPSNSSSSQSQALPGSQPSQRTIPGPTWLWLEPFNVPLRHYTRLHKRRPYIVQLCSALLIYLLGDLSAQRITLSSSSDPDAAYNPFQTARALTIGALSAIPSYRWFLWLGNQWNGLNKPLSIGLKVVVNQIVFTPLFNTYFFSMQMLLSSSGWTADGRVRWTAIKERVVETVPRSWVNSWKVWPSVTAVSFLWIPLELRSVFAGE